MGRRAALSLATFALALAALPFGCDPDINDEECLTTADCAFRTGTVCSPEGWCVLPEAARPDQGVEPDMRVDLDRGPAPDAAADMATLPDIASPDIGPALDGDVDGALGDATVEPADGGAADLAPADDMTPADDMMPSVDMMPVEDMAPVDDMDPADAGEAADGEPIEPADALPAVPA